MPAGLDLPKVRTHRMMLEKLQELFREMVEGPRGRWIQECLGLPGMMRTSPSPMV